MIVFGSDVYIYILVICDKVVLVDGLMVFWIGLVGKGLVLDDVIVLVVSCLFGDVDFW